MKRFLAAAFALLLLVPGVAQAREPEAYPDELVALLPKWIERAQEAGAGQQDTAWWPEAGTFLARAEAAAEEGRVRLTLFHLETYHELVAVGTLLDEANATFASDAERKNLVIDRTQALRDDADRAWSDYRVALHAFDSNLRSLHSAELALHSADLAVGAMLGGGKLQDVVREFQKQPGVPKGYVMALARGSSTISLNLGYARDILEVAAAQEGLPPALREENWTATMRAVLEPVSPDEVAAHNKAHEELAGPARANNESLLVTAIALAQERTNRGQTMYTIFGDARSRGMNVIGDAVRGMSRQANNTTMDGLHSYGLLGVQMASALDHALYVEQLAYEGKADLGAVLLAWSGLDHAAYVSSILASSSSVTPPPPKTSGAPLPGAALVFAGVGLAALALRRRA